MLVSPGGSSPPGSELSYMNVTHTKPNMQKRQFAQRRWGSHLALNFLTRALGIQRLRFDIKLSRTVRSAETFVE
jgi:hypothetical protein